MIDIVKLARWDWFKLARRWLPWILLIVFLLSSQLAVWGSYLQYQGLQQTGGSVTVGTGASQRDVNCDVVLAGTLSKLPAGTTPEILHGLQADCRQISTTIPQRLRQFADGFSLPGSIPSTLGLAIPIGLVLLVILTASVFGAEYGWGTVRPILAGGTSRGAYLGAKILMLAVLTAGALLALVAATALTSLIATNLVPSPAAGALTTWGGAAIAIGRTWLALLPYLVFTAFATIVSRSTASGMAIGIGYYLAERLIVLLLGGGITWFPAVGNELLGANIAAFSGVGVFGGRAASSGMHAFLILLGYTLVFGAVMFAVFRSRDVAGASAS